MRTALPRELTLANGRRVEVPPGLYNGDTVLVDPEGNVPTELAREVDPGALLGILVVGVVGMALVLVALATLPPRTGGVDGRSGGGGG